MENMEESEECGMKQEHRNILMKHYSSLVEGTNLKDLMPLLIERGLLTTKMIESYSTYDKECNRNFYLDIQRRGPKAFRHLCDILQETAHWNLLKLISPNHPLNTSNQTFFSLARTKKRAAKIEKPQEPVKLPAIENLTILDNSKPMDINVIKSQKYHESPNPAITCYYFRSKRRGICLFFNNIDYERNLEKPRTGAEIDQKNLKNLFTQIGIEFVPHVNKTKQEFEKILDNFTKSPELHGINCVFVIIASHGSVDHNSNDVIRCSDGDEIRDDDIVKRFNNENCVLLQHIPKIFIFQKCRGKNLDFGLTSATQNTEPSIMSLSERTETEGREIGVNMTTYSDMIIVHSTLKGYVSFRDKESGSWYFIAMCEVFMKHAHDTHIADLFTLTDERLKKIDFEKNVVQSSHVSYIGFNQYLFLHPGFPEDHFIHAVDQT